jgi:hypothetical protein
LKLKIVSTWKRFLAPEKNSYMEERKPKKVDFIEKGLHFKENIEIPTELDPESHKKRLFGVMARDRARVRDVLKLKKRIL